MKHLRAGSLVMVVVLTSPRAHGHWSLAAGWEEEQQDALGVFTSINRKRRRAPVARALLCLDPGASAPTITAYIARIELTSRRGKLQKYQYVSGDGVMSRVAMTEAIALRLTPQRRLTTRRDVHRTEGIDGQS